jgi:hypothetical protein
MRLLSIVPALALALLWSPFASASSDCHYDMKDMLQGTLEVAQHAGSEPPEQRQPADCTLAAWQALEMKQQAH